MPVFMHEQEKFYMFAWPVAYLLPESSAYKKWTSMNCIVSGT